MNDSECLSPWQRDTLAKMLREERAEGKRLILAVMIGEPLAGPMSNLEASGMVSRVAGTNPCYSYYVLTEAGRLAAAQG